MDNSEKLATKGTPDEDKQNRNTTQYVMDTTMRKHTHVTEIRHILISNLLTLIMLFVEYVICTKLHGKHIFKLRY